MPEEMKFAIKKTFPSLLTDFNTDKKHRENLNLKSKPNNSIKEKCEKFIQSKSNATTRRLILR